jgi:hypothetical protein
LIDRFITALRELGLEPDLDELVDVLWLAQQLPPPQATRGPSAPITSGDENQGTASTKAATPSAQDGTAGLGEEWPRAIPKVSEPQGWIKKGVSAAVRLPSLPSAPGDGGAPSAGLPFRAPAAAALPAALEIARALRPLQRRVASQRVLHLDEVATARRSLEEKRWTPVFRPSKSRWLELALVIDGTRSMAIWHRTVADLTRLFEQQGAFRDVRVWTVETSGDEEAPPLRSGAPGAAGPLRDARELVDPTGRRLTLLVTDAVAPAFWNGRMMRLLALWGQHSPTAILEVLPERLWTGTALGAAPAVAVRAAAPGVLRVEMPRRLARRLRGIPVPVVTLEPEPMGKLARLVAGIGDERVPGLLADPRGEPSLPVGGAAALAQSTLDGDARVQRYDAVASPTAQTLARLFAAAPLSLPVMRLIRESMLPGATQAHLAEVFLGGLLEEITLPGPRPPPEEIRYDFRPGVRAVLLRSLPADASVAVLRRVSNFVAQHLGRPVDFAAMLADPRTAADWLGSEDARPFAEVAAEVLRPLGGAYAKLAERLEGEASPEPPTPVTGRFNGHWVLVAGTGGELSAAEQLASRVVGEVLAESGYGLIDGGWRGVDSVVADAFARRTRDLGIPAFERVLHIIDGRDLPRLAVGRLLQVSLDAHTDVSVARASAVILIGGSSGTYYVYERARALGKRCIPLPATEGAAGEAFLKMLHVRRGHDVDQDVAALDVPCTTETEAEELGRRVLAQLREMPEKEPSLIALGPTLLVTGRYIVPREGPWRIELADLMAGVDAIERFITEFPQLPLAMRYLVVADEGEARNVAGPPRLERTSDGRWVLDVVVEPAASRMDLESVGGIEELTRALRVVALANRETSLLERWSARAPGRVRDLFALEVARLAAFPDGDRSSLRAIERVLDVTELRSVKGQDRLTMRLLLDVCGKGRWEATLTVPAPGGAATLVENGVWILLDGTDRFELPPAQLEEARNIGKYLARAGFSLVTFGSHGIAYVVAEGFWNVLESRGYASGIYRLQHIVSSEAPSEFKPGRAVFPAQGESRVSAALAAVDAVLRVGDSSFSHEIDRLASSSSVRLVLESDSNWQKQLEAIVDSRTGVANDRDPDPSLEPLLVDAAQALDEPKLSQFETHLAAIRNKLQGVTTDGLGRSLVIDSRASHRLLGYLLNDAIPDDATVDVLVQELRAARSFRETRTLWRALSKLQSLSGGSHAVPAAAICACFEIECERNPQVDRRGLCRERIEGLRLPMARARKLARTARDYDEVRRLMPAGNERTARMNDLVLSIIASSGVAEARAFFRAGSGGQRVVALRLAYLYANESGMGTTAARDLVFISYRRTDAGHQAGRLANELKRRFGESRVFFDAESIEGGQPFPRRIQDALARACVVLVLIGRRWLAATDEWGRRKIDDSNDWVHQEVSRALGDEAITLIPVLIDHAEMPPSAALPSAIAPTVHRQAMSLTHELFTREAEEIGDRIARLGIDKGTDDGPLRENREAFTLVEESIRKPRSPFEQYHGLLLAKRLLDVLSPSEQIRLRDAIREQRERGVLTDRDRSRWDLSSELLARLSPTASAAAIQPLTIADLQPADILLSKGKGFVSDLIAEADGGHYSHGALWSGMGIIQATSDGITHSEIHGTHTVYRYPDLPQEAAKKIVAVAMDQVDSTYAYGELVMLGTLFLSGIRVKGALLDRLLDAIGGPTASKLKAWLDERAGKGVRVCTELVASAYYEAVKEGAYALKVRPRAGGGAGARAIVRAALSQRNRGTQVITSGIAPTVEDTNRQKEAVEAAQSCIDLFVRSDPSLPDKVWTRAPSPSMHSPTRKVLAGAIARDAVTNEEVGVVTPADLEFSPSLKLVGRLEA